MTAARKSSGARLAVNPLGWEEQEWDPLGGISGLTRQERKAQFGSKYKSAIPARIAGMDVSVPSGISAELDEATTGLAKFDAEGKFRSSAFLAVMLRSESSSSSQIEKITASARRIAEAELTGQGSGNAAVIAANTHAMIEALSFDGPVTPERIESIQQTLLAHEENLAGWRTEPVWIGGDGSTPFGADFVPPTHTRVPECIDDLVEFLARDDIPPLAQAAIAHAQFETIHPFPDGNGRTRRALVHAVLKSKELVASTTAPISAGLLTNKGRYFEALDRFREGDAAPIVSVFSRAALHAVHQGTVLGSRVDDLYASWKSRIAARKDSAVWRVLEVFTQHPVVDAETAAEQSGVGPTNIYRHLRKLTESKVIAGTPHYKSGQYLYRAPEMLTLLDVYAKDLGRRER